MKYIAPIAAILIVTGLLGSAAYATSGAKVSYRIVISNQSVEQQTAANAADQSVDIAQMTPVPLPPHKPVR